MPGFTVDLEQITQAVGGYRAAADRVAQGRATLLGPLLTSGALGGTPSAQALAHALRELHSAQADAAARNGSALTEFADRLQGVVALGGSALAESTAAARLG